MAKERFVVKKSIIYKFGVIEPAADGKKDVVLELDTDTFDKKSLQALLKGGHLVGIENKPRRNKRVSRK